MSHATTPFAFAFLQVLDIVFTLDARGPVLLEDIHSVIPIKSTAVDKISIENKKDERKAETGEGGVHDTGVRKENSWQNGKKGSRHCLH